MAAETIYLVAIFFTFACFEAAKTGFWKKPGQRPNDGWIELITGLAVVVVTQPLVLYLGFQLAAKVAPDSAGVLIGLAIPLQILLLLVLDDMMQYWWHRFSHSFAPLYRLHRAHHDVNYLSIRVVYRNNLWYYFFMPSLWFVGILIYLGLAEVYAYYLAVKMTVITGAHSDVHWDEQALQNQSPAAAYVGFGTDYFYAVYTFAHHGLHASDVNTHYKGNYGNLLFFWDVLFGTARITRGYPAGYGVENLPDASLERLVAWPLWPAKKSNP